MHITVGQLLSAKPCLCVGSVQTCGATSLDTHRRALSRRSIFLSSHGPILRHDSWAATHPHSTATDGAQRRRKFWSFSSGGRCGPAFRCGRSKIILSADLYLTAYPPPPTMDRSIAPPTDWLGELEAAHPRERPRLLRLRRRQPRLAAPRTPRPAQPCEALYRPAFCCGIALAAPPRRHSSGHKSGN